MSGLIVSGQCASTKMDYKRLHFTRQDAINFLRFAWAAFWHTLQFCLWNILLSLPTEPGTRLCALFGLNRGQVEVEVDEGPDTGIVRVRAVAHEATAAHCYDFWASGGAITSSVVNSSRGMVTFSYKGEEYVITPRRLVGRLPGVFVCLKEPGNEPGKKK